MRDVEAVAISQANGIVTVKGPGQRPIEVKPKDGRRSNHPPADARVSIENHEEKGRLACLHTRDRWEAM